MRLRLCVPGILVSVLVVGVAGVWPQAADGPYQLVKDTRTGYEIGNAQAVLDGELDPFIREYLLARAAGRVV